MRRLAPGLRREEVAAMAGVGVTWYTWLEQGREINVSDETLERVSRALKLSASDKEYFYALAGLPLRRRRATTVSASMRSVVAGFTAWPALLLNARLDVLVHNDLADRVFSLSAGAGRFAKNHVWRVFLDPERRRLYRPGTPATERNLVGRFRAAYAEHIGEPEFEELIGVLNEGSPLFAELWGERETYPMATNEVPLDHPSLGPLRFHSARATPDECTGNLLSLLPPADEATVTAMRRAQDLLEGDRARSARRGGRGAKPA
jgi:hypothetical protein